MTRDGWLERRQAGMGRGSQYELLAGPLRARVFSGKGGWKYELRGGPLGTMIAGAWPRSREARAACEFKIRALLSAECAA
jgi:hypothetical protein